MIKPFRGNFRQSQGFGGNADMYRRFNLIGHNGIDWAVPIGTQLISPIEGVVVEADFDEGGYGWYVKVENNTEGALLAHLSEVQVQIGFVIEQGQHLGLSGNTGNCIPKPTADNPTAGAHLHFGYYRIPRNRSNGYNGYIDPTPYLQVTEGDTPMEIKPPLNTYGLDDTNVDSKQVVYDAWYQLSQGKYMPKDEVVKLTEELNQKITDLTNEREDLKKKFDESFKFLGEVNDLGFMNKEQLIEVVYPYREMYLKGYISLQAIEAKLAGFVLQLDEYKQALEDLKESDRKQIDELQAKYDAAVKAGLQNELDKIELQKKIDELNTKIISMNPSWIWEQFVKFLGVMKIRLPANTHPIIDKAIAADPDKINQAVIAYKQLNESIGFIK